jgi:hypothetical protein
MSVAVVDEELFAPVRNHFSYLPLAVTERGCGIGPGSVVLAEAGGTSDGDRNRLAGRLHSPTTVEAA